MTTDAPGWRDARILKGTGHRAEQVVHAAGDAPGDGGRPGAALGGRPGCLRITGAGGWIGARLVRQARDAGLEAAGVPRGAWLDGAPDAAALAGAAVVHLAAIAHRPAGLVDAAVFERVNHAAAVSFARRARSAGAARFVFVSTAAVMPPGSARAWTEADAPDPRDAYARAKLAAEAQLRALHEPGRFEVVVLRPPLVYGPGARANFRRLLELAAGGWPLPLGGATAPRSMVFVDNLVSALLHAAGSPRAAGQTFFVTDGTERSVADWIQAVRARLGRPARLFTLPAPIVRAAARASGRWPVYERLFLPMRVDGSALRATGWRPPVEPDEALARTLAAYPWSEP